MGIVDLTSKLTNSIIKVGSLNLYSNKSCIGGLFLMKVLEERGFEYSCVEWGNKSGYVAIFNKLYNVTAIYKGKPFNMMDSEASFFNRICPKKITLTFEFIG